MAYHCQNHPRARQLRSHRRTILPPPPRCRFCDGIPQRHRLPHSSSGRIHGHRRCPAIPSHRRQAQQPYRPSYPVDRTFPSLASLSEESLTSSTTVNLSTKALASAVQHETYIAWRRDANAFDAANPDATVLNREARRCIATTQPNSDKWLQAVSQSRPCRTPSCPPSAPPSRSSAGSAST